MSTDTHSPTSPSPKDSSLTDSDTRLGARSASPSWPLGLASTSDVSVMDTSEDNIITAETNRINNAKLKLTPKRLKRKRPSASAQSDDNRSKHNSGGNTDDDLASDDRGYYIFQPGEIINETYEIKYQQGRGVFSNVAFATRKHLNRTSQFLTATASMTNDSLPSDTAVVVAATTHTPQQTITLTDSASSTHAESTQPQATSPGNKVNGEASSNDGDKEDHQKPDTSSTVAASSSVNSKIVVATPPTTTSATALQQLQRRRRRQQNHHAAAQGLGSPEELSEIDLVAVKVLRRNETTQRAGSNEESILQDIHKIPRASREYIVEFIESFFHRQHLCLVFHAMKLNLRQLLVKYGRNTGINIDGVRRYGRHIFSALETLRSLGIVHADVKLDNIIVSADLRVAKLCDFGSAFYATEVPEASSHHTMYLVSRFYRAPELVLGLTGKDVGPALDVWSLGSCLFELYSGNVLFPGRTNNEMLALIMRARGKIPSRLIKRHLAASSRLDREPLFDATTMAFRQKPAHSPNQRHKVKHHHPNPAANSPSSVQLIDVPTDPLPANTVGHFVHEAHPDIRDQVTTAERKQLIALLNRALILDPAERITPAEALARPFFTSHSDSD